MNIKQQALGGFTKDSDETVLVKGKTVHMVYLMNGENRILRRHQGRTS